MAKKEKPNAEMQKLYKRFQDAQKQYTTGYQQAMSEYQGKLADYSKLAEKYESDVAGYLAKSKEYGDYLSSFYITDPKKGPDVVVRDGGTFKASSDGKSYYEVPGSSNFQFVKTGVKPVQRTGVRYIYPTNPQAPQIPRAEYYTYTQNFDTGYLKTPMDGKFTEKTPEQFTQRVAPQLSGQSAPVAPEMSDVAPLRQKFAEEQQYFERESGERKLAASRARRRTQERPLLAGEKV